MLYAIANINATKVFWVEFSRNESVSLIMILVMTKQPAATSQKVTRTQMA